MSSVYTTFIPTVRKLKKGPSHVAGGMAFSPCYHTIHEEWLNLFISPNNDGEDDILSRFKQVPGPEARPGPIVSLEGLRAWPVILKALSTPRPGPSPSFQAEPGHKNTSHWSMGRGKLNGSGSINNGEDREVEISYQTVGEVKAIIFVFSSGRVAWMGGAEELRVVENGGEGPRYQEGWNMEVVGHIRWAMGEMDGGVLEGVAEQCLNKKGFADGGESTFHSQWQFDESWTGSEACFSLCGKTKASEESHQGKIQPYVNSTRQVCSWM
ncbi:hypothetical protein EDC04DRAFT_2603973 [Pisolithus marmoratus]|nr:hypothetical protein EDC04DRAFT_2603973 [Pisolithus marmoratus]